MEAAKAFSINQSLISNEVPFRNGKIRFLVLILLALVLVTLMFAFNNPQALQDSIMKELKLSETQFNMLYTIIALPNLFCPFFVGIAIDFIGVKISLIVLMISIVCFQAIVACGAVYHSYETMLVGRMLFGIAMEGVTVAQTCFVSYWFLGKELAFAIGMATTLPELGSALNSLITPIIYEKSQNIGTPLLTSVGICVFGLICACGAVYIDKIADEEDRQHNLRVVTDDEDIMSYAGPETIKLKDLKQLQGVFWVLVSLCLLSIGQYIPFLDNVNNLIQVRFCFSQVTAGRNIMITYLVTAFLGLPLGIAVDKIGFKRYMIMIGMTVLVVAHMIIFFWPQCDFIGTYTNWSGASWGLLMLGLGFCFYANCIVPSIPIIVSKKITGTAFGIMLIFENFAMAICPIITGQIVYGSDTKYIGYKRSSLFFVVLGICGICLSFALFFIKYRSKQLLDGKSDIKKVYAIQLNPSFSDDEYIRRLKTPTLVSFSSLDERLIRTYQDLGAEYNQKKYYKPKYIYIFPL